MTKFLILSWIACMLFTACSSEIIEEKEEEFQVVSPLLTDTLYTHEYVAQILAIQNVEIRARVKGFIDKIHIDEGQRVYQGQTLFSINDKTFLQESLKANAATKSVLAELKAAEIELANTKKLLDKNIIALPEYELATAKVEALKAKVEEAKAVEAHAELFLSLAKIKAPFSGIINRIPNKTGSLVEEGQLLTTLSDNKEVLAYFNFSEKEYLNHIASAQNNTLQKVALILADGSAFPHSGFIETSESEFDLSTGNIAYRARFPNPNGLLKHGSNAKVLIENTLNDALIIPQKSTFELLDKTYVYVVKSDSTLEQRTIQTKLRLPHVYVIESGLNANEKIVYEGVENVTDGQKIIPVPTTNIK